MGFLENFANRREPIQPGIDTSKGSIYHVGAIIIGFWVLSVPATPLVMLITQSQAPLDFMQWLWGRFFIPTIITAAVMVSGVVLSRYRKGGIPRRMTVHWMELERPMDGKPKHVVRWEPYDKVPGVMKHWFPSAFYGVGDWFVEMFIRFTGGHRSPMVERPPNFNPGYMPPEEFKHDDFVDLDEDGEDDRLRPAGPSPRLEGSFDGLRDLFRRRGWRG